MVSVCRTAVVRAAPSTSRGSGTSVAITSAAPFHMTRARWSDVAWPIITRFTDTPPFMAYASRTGGCRSYGAKNTYSTTSESARCVIVSGDVAVPQPVSMSPVRNATSPAVATVGPRAAMESSTRTHRPEKSGRGCAPSRGVDSSAAPNRKSRPIVISATNVRRCRERGKSAELFAAETSAAAEQARECVHDIGDGGYRSKRVHQPCHRAQKVAGCTFGPHVHDADGNVHDAKAGGIHGDRSEIHVHNLTSTAATAAAEGHRARQVLRDHARSGHFDVSNEVVRRRQSRERAELQSRNDGIHIDGDFADHVDGKLDDVVEYESGAAWRGGGLKIGTVRAQRRGGRGVVTGGERDREDGKNSCERLHEGAPAEVDGTRSSASSDAATAHS